MDKMEGLPVNAPERNYSQQIHRHITNNEQLWTVDDVAQYLQLQPETIRALARRGELPALKIGKVWRFHKSAIHSLVTPD
jgi:excisionase family DNA binding protein